MRASVPESFSGVVADAATAASRLGAWRMSAKTTPAKRRRRSRAAAPPRTCAGRYREDGRASARTTAGARSTRTSPRRRAPQTQVTRGARAQHHQPQRLARHRLQPVDQSLPRLRARLRLLLRAARRTPTWTCRRASISRPSCSPRPMPPSACARNSPSPATAPSPIALGINTDAYQPIERRYRITRQRARGAGRMPASGQLRHQERADRARPRPAGADGARRPGARCTSR